MTVRTANEGDVPAIVDLLRLSLGDGHTPKSESYWRWKHIENPFGRSPVLLGLQGTTLVGVRAFMKWRFISGGTVSEAVRAVDTATHPNFRGQGIFNKLTLSLIKECENSEVGFVFNTPNKISKSGYLKMGWQEAGRLPITIKFPRPLSILSSHFRHISPLNLSSAEIEDKSVAEYLSHPDLVKLLADCKSAHANKLVTDHSAESLAWRYLHVKVAKYFAAGIADEEGLRALFFYRFKASKLGKELRISDFFMCEPSAIGEVNKLIRRKLHDHNADYATISGLNMWVQSSFPALPFSLGPMVTVRDLSGPRISELQKFRNWNPSIGDLELF